MDINFSNESPFNTIYFIKKVNGQDVDSVDLVLVELRRQLSMVNLAVRVTELVEIDQINDTTLVVAIGGDGTMLYAASIAAPVGATLLGVNMGAVGFLTDFSLADVANYNYLWQILMGAVVQKFPIEERIMLSVTPPNGPRFTTMNEVSIANKYSDSIINYDIKIDGIEAGTHRANSVIVSTPTGSTAYALSAGGAIMYPTLKALEIIPVAPITMTSRPIIVGGHSSIEIIARVRDGGTISARGDGRLLGDYITSNSDETISFTMKVHTHPVRLIRPPSWNFFNLLTNKLGWNQ